MVVVRHQDHKSGFFIKPSQLYLVGISHGVPPASSSCRELFRAAVAQHTDLQRRPYETDRSLTSFEKVVMKTDKQLQEDVLAELDWESSVVDADPILTPARSAARMRATKFTLAKTAASPWLRWSRTLPRACARPLA